MAELTDDELEAIKLQARESVDYEAAGCVRGSRMGLRLADAAERRALYKAGESAGFDAHALVKTVAMQAAMDWRARVDAIRCHWAARLVADHSGAAMHDVEDALARLHARLTAPELPLSCGCPPEHHDEAKRRLADTMRRDGVITEEDR